ncbi:MAG: transposase [Chloroflexi bacterium]|nr:transposase [Chloroflexota bacterium]
MEATTGRTGFFSYVNCEARVPATYPLCLIRAMVDEVLEHLSRDFEGLYSKMGRPLVPPEKLLRALFLQAFYSIRSERQLMEQMDYNLLFRWFVGLSMDAAAWDATMSSKHRDWLLGGGVGRKFLAVVVEQARRHGLQSDDHFPVDGTLIEAWASIQSFPPKDGADKLTGSGCNSERNFRGDKRFNEIHASTTDPDARLSAAARSLVSADMLKSIGVPVSGR